MTISREDAIALAKEAGFRASVGKTDNEGNYHPDKNALSKDVPVEWVERLCNLAVEQSRKGVEPVAYIAWSNGKPCYEGDDAICEAAVWPVDSDDDRTSMPVYIHPAPSDEALLRQAHDAIMYGGTIDAMNAIMTAIRARLEGGV